MVHAPSGTSPAMGSMLGRKYRVLSQLGRGGMGVVVAAENASTGARVAVKLLRETAQADPDIVSRFMREARATASLKSRFIVTVYDVDVAEDGSPFIVMELLEGRDLASHLRENRAEAIDEIVGWIVQAASGLARAHESGIVHRDLKPANLFLASGPTVIVKVVDFGVSKMMAEPELTELTMSGDVFGTAHWMAPEQLRDSKAVDGRADIWALGVILYRALEGRMPFEGSSAEVIAQVLDDAPAPPPRRADLPAALVAAIMGAIAKNPAHRFGSMSALAAALAPFARKTPPVLEALADLASIEAPSPADAAVTAPPRTVPMPPVASAPVVSPRRQVAPTAPPATAPTTSSATSAPSPPVGAVVAGIVAALLVVAAVIALVTFLRRPANSPTASPSSLASSLASTAATNDPAPTPPSSAAEPPPPPTSIATSTSASATSAAPAPSVRRASHPRPTASSPHERPSTINPPRL